MDISAEKAGVGATLIVVNNLMPVLMGIFTGWFENGILQGLQEAQKAVIRKIF